MIKRLPFIHIPVLISILALDITQVNTQLARRLFLSMFSQKLIILQMRHFILELIRTRFLDSVPLVNGLLTYVHPIKISFKIHDLSI